MVIRLTTEDRLRSVELLHSEEAYHLVREGHLTQGDSVIGSGVDFVREAVGTADDEDHPTLPRDHHPLYVGGEGRARELPSPLVEEDQTVCRRHQTKNLRSLGLLLELGGEFARSSDVGDDLKGEGEVVSEAVGVELRELFDMPAVGLAYG